jgi:hypothetical protein
MLLHNDALPVINSVAGLLVLLYGRPVSKICRLTDADVIDVCTALKLKLGPTPIENCHRLSTISADNFDCTSSVTGTGHAVEHPWLFPGSDPADPMSQATIGRRVHNMGISARESRNAAPMLLAVQLPTRPRSSTDSRSDDIPTPQFCHVAGTAICSADP